MIQSKRDIKASAQSIWQVLTTKEKMKEWYFDIPDFELKEGAIFNFFEPGEKKLFHHQCTIIEIIPFHQFSHTWTHPEISKGISTVVWHLREKNNGETNVILEHKGVENFSDAGPAFEPENFQKGWDGILSNLKNYMYGVRKHLYTIEIQASPQKVWDVLWNKHTYKEWQKPIRENGNYLGEIISGNRIHFISSTGNGMYSDVVYCAPEKHVIFQHIGEMADGAELPIDFNSEKWTGTFEQYQLQEKNGITILTIEKDIAPENYAHIDQAYKLSLKIIKHLSESK